MTTDLTFAPDDTMHLLEQGLPLSLLLDLADPDGPRSADILRHETSSIGASGLRGA